MTLKEYILAFLGEMGEFIGLTDTSFIESEILSEYGVSKEEDATDLNKLYAIAKYKSWERVLIQVSAFYDFSADERSYKTSDILDTARNMMENYYIEAIPYLKKFQVEVERLNYSDDPYKG